MSDLTDQQIKDNLARALKPLPCPFCGADDIRFREGSTFRWIVAYCVYCDAQCGEVRRNTMIPTSESQPQAEADAIAAWNKRATAQFEEAIREAVTALYKEQAETILAVRRRAGNQWNDVAETVCDELLEAVEREIK